jgi:hypothetical protein
MADQPIQNYNQTPNKLRVLWDKANILIAKHEELLRRQEVLETKLKTLQKSITFTLEGA